MNHPPFEIAVALALSVLLSACGHTAASVPVGHARTTVHASGEAESLSGDELVAQCHDTPPATSAEASAEPPAPESSADRGAARVDATGNAIATDR